jgi:hypothetical protein
LRIGHPDGQVFNGFSAALGGLIGRASRNERGYLKREPRREDNTTSKNP